jgi:hypothetical protein
MKGLNVEKFLKMNIENLSSCKVEQLKMLSKVIEQVLCITIGQLDVEKPSTKEANVTSTTTMTFGLVGALGRKVKPTITTSMIAPLKIKCLM